MCEDEGGIILLCEVSGFIYTFTQWEEKNYFQS
jgi:hypothetical protein